MAHIVTGGADIKHDSLAVIPLGGQGEHGQVLWIFIYGGEILLVDAGAAYPTGDLPGVDLLLPNTNFLKANQERILALLLSNAHEEHCGGVSYLLNHLNIPRIMGPRFVSVFLAQCAIGGNPDGSYQCPQVDTVSTHHTYQIGPFAVEWIRVNDAIADACALSIATPAGRVVYTSSFKLDQTPVDGRLMDVARLAQAGDEGVLLLVSDSRGVESQGYSPSERAVAASLGEHVSSASGRVIVVMPGTNSHRLQIVFDIARSTSRKVAVLGETLIRTAVTAAITGDLVYDRGMEASLENLRNLEDKEILIAATGIEGDPMNILSKLAYGQNKDITITQGDLIIYSAGIYAGRARQMAVILDQFLLAGIKVVSGEHAGVHVSKHGAREELKLMLSLTKPKFFIPALGKGRHIMHHAQLAGSGACRLSQCFP